MKIYLAGNPGTRDNAILYNKNIEKRLTSFFDLKIETHRASPYEFNLIKNNK